MQHNCSPVMTDCTFHVTLPSGVKYSTNVHMLSRDEMTAFYDRLARYNGVITSMSAVKTIVVASDEAEQMRAARAEIAEAAIATASGAVARAVVTLAEYATKRGPCEAH